MVSRRGSKAPSNGTPMGRRGRKRKKVLSGEGGGPEPGRIEYGPILSVPEAARYLRVTVRTVHRLKSSGQLPFVQVGGRVLFRRRDIEKFVSERLRVQK